MIMVALCATGSAMLQVEIKAETRISAAFEIEVGGRGSVQKEVFVYLKAFLTYASGCQVMVNLVNGDIPIWRV